MINKDNSRIGEEILRIVDLKKYYLLDKKNQKQYVKAVDGVSLSIKRGESLGLVGESGCGKTTLVNTILNLIKPTEGSVLFHGLNLFDSRNRKMLRKSIQIVFQDPFWSLNPRMTIKNIIAEPLLMQTKMNKMQQLERIQEVMEMVGLNNSDMDKYPHEFSGGQRQRIAIARAIATFPEIIILDEPTSSIDIVSQKQILSILAKLRERFGLTYILISHDMSVVKNMTDHIAVMYLGKIVEYNTTKEIFENPKHPYTTALFRSIPSAEMESVKDLKEIAGEIPSTINIPKGCRFHTRCEQCFEKCRNIEPAFFELSEEHKVACHKVCSE